MTYRETDEILRRHLAMLQDWPCGPGCSKCCEESFFLINSLEFKVIQKHLQTWNNYHLSRLQERMERAISRLQKYHPKLIKFLDSIEINRHILSKGEYSKLFHVYDSLCQQVKNVPCPFLHHNMCSIYEVRPMVCRTYGLTFDTLEERGIIKYNVCDKLNNPNAKSRLLDGIYLGIEINILRYNQDWWPLPIWLYRAMPDLTFIPNEWREFRDDVLTLDEFRLLQRYFRRNPKTVHFDKADQEAAEQIISRLNNRPNSPRKP